MILVVLVAVLTDAAATLIIRSGVVQLPFDKSTLISALVMSWYTLTELGSALENAEKMTGMPIPWLSRFLRRAADAVDDAGDELAPGKGADRDA